MRARITGTGAAFFGVVAVLGFLPKAFADDAPTCRRTLSAVPAMISVSDDSVRAHICNPEVICEQSCPNQIYDVVSATEDKLIGLRLMLLSLDKKASIATLKVSDSDVCKLAAIGSECLTLKYQ